MDRRGEGARSGDTTDRATEMGFNLVLLKRFRLHLRQSFHVVVANLCQREKSIPDQTAHAVIEPR